MTKNSEFSPICMANANYDWSEVRNPITKQQVLDWVKVLVQGDYQQTTEALTCCSCYCCLGVLAQENQQLNDGYFHPPEQISYERCYLSVFDFNTKLYTDYYLPMELQNAFAELNDKRNPFPAIAAYIEYVFGLSQ